MLKFIRTTKGSMKKIFGLLVALFLLNGCAESLALLSTSASSGKIAQSSLNSAISFGVKKETGKTPLEHAIAYAGEKNPEKQKEPCLSFIEKTNSEICAIVKKQLEITKSKILKMPKDKSFGDLRSSIQPSIFKRSKIQYLD